MARIYLFSDESGNFDFSRNPGASRYFSIGTLVLRDGEPAQLRGELLSLRERLAWRGHGLDTAFHATKDAQVVRDEVFELLARHPGRYGVTLLEKSKALPRIRDDEPTFYKYALYYHLKNLIPQVAQTGDSLMMVASELGTKKRRAAHRGALEDVIGQLTWHLETRVAFWPTISDPCLQAADYGLWAVQRKWERGDDRSEVLIRHQIHSQYDLWSAGRTHHY